MIVAAPVRIRTFTKGCCHKVASFFVYGGKMYKDTITLFNRYTIKDRKVIWYPTIMRGVNLNVDKASIVAKYGSNSQDNAILNVKYQNTDDGVKVSDKLYLLPKEWSKHTENALKESFTFIAGTQEFDFFYIGEWKNEDNIFDDDYINGFYSHMKNNYDNVFAITSVSKFSVIPHFEVVGK